MAEISSTSTSHGRDLVAQIVQGDPEKAEVLVRLLALADASTPKGAAIRTDLMMFAYSYTDDCRGAMQNFVAA
jgi:hypothetical protein